MLRHGVEIFRAVPAGKNSPKDPRMEGLDPAFHHLGKSRVGRHILHRNTGLLEKQAGAARAEDLNSQFVELSGELGQTRFVADTDQRPLRLDDHHVNLQISPDLFPNLPL